MTPVSAPGMMPKARPDMKRGEALQLAVAAGCSEAAFILGRRGYYRDTMGVAGANDRGIYDDAITVVTPTAYATFNGNCDPAQQGGRLASLVPGIWRYKLGIHHPGTDKAAPCLVQAAPVTVRRDNGVTETGEFYIHIHRGYYNETGSEGCQTVHPDQWDAFFALVKGEIERYKMLSIPYVLTERGQDE